MTRDAAARASEMILTRKEDLAREITEALYAGQPELLERFGETGRAKCLQDMRYNLEHLAPAVGLEDPSLFGRYVRWLADMLRARGIPGDDVRHSLELTREVVAARLPADEASCITTALGAGLAALSQSEAR